MENGAEVVLVDVQEEKLKQVVEHYRSLGYKAYGIAGNLADREELGRIFDQALEVLGGKEKFCCYTYSREPDGWDVNVFYKEDVYLDRAERYLIERMKEVFAF